MSKLTWDVVGERLYETGTRRGVLYPFNSTSKAYDSAVAWNGLTAVTASPEGGDPNDLYADDIKYLSLRAAENFKCTIEAYTYPDEFAECDGSAYAATGVKIGQQPRKAFGFSWQSVLGNDTDLDKHGYIIHIIWGGTAAPSEKAYQTINDSPEAITFSWEIDTVPVEIPNTNYKATAYMEIDSTKADAAKLTALKDILYGTDNAEAHLPMPGEIITMMS